MERHNLVSLRTYLADPLTAYIDGEDRFFVFGGIADDGRLYRDVWELAPAAP